MDWREIKEGQHFTNSKGEEYVVVKSMKLDNPRVTIFSELLILFPETGNYETTYNTFIGTDRCFDHSKPYLCNVGYYTGTKDNPVRLSNENDYLIWGNMIRRCYQKGQGFKSWKGASVCEEWFNYSSFRLWCENYRRISPKYSGISLALDKDLFSIKGVKLYSPETCCFLPSELNSAIRTLQRLRNGEDIREATSLLKGILNLTLHYFSMLPTKVTSKLLERVSLSLQSYPTTKVASAQTTQPDPEVGED